MQFQYGFNSKTLQKLIKHWHTEYKWREREVQLNRFPQFKTNIQGLDVHFLHVKPPAIPVGKKTIPLLLLHGWPGSVREFYSLIDLLTQQIPKGDDTVFEVIAPSLPGYGFSSGAVRPGLGSAQVAVVLAQLMRRLGHTSWYVQGGDWGSQIASHMGILYPQEVKGIHINMCASMSPKTHIFTVLMSIWPSLFMEERFARRTYPMWERFGDKLLETGYMHIQATKPDTVGIALADSPAGLAAYILEKFSTGTNGVFRSLEDGGLTNHFTYDDLLDNVMIYWWSNSMTTAMRLYAENFSKEYRSLGFENAPVPTPTWCARFPYEIFYQPDWMLKHRYVKLLGVTDMAEGGHFAALERPKDLADDIKHAIQVFEQEKHQNP